MRILAWIKNSIKKTKKTPVVVWAICCGLIAEIAVYSGITGANHYRYTLQTALILIGVFWVLMGLSLPGDRSRRENFGIALVWGIAHVIATVIVVLAAYDYSLASIGFIGIMIASAFAGSLSNTGTAIIETRSSRRATCQDDHSSTTQGMGFGRITLICVASFMIFLIAPYVVVVIGVGLGYAIGIIFKDLTGAWLSLLRVWFVAGAIVGLALGGFTMSSYDNGHNVVKEPQ
jgi:hypothetical protein